MAQPASAAAPVARPATLTVPSDAATRHVQTLLHSFGYSVVVDGNYGPQTRKALMHFQKANRLTVDGIPGTITIARLESADAPTATVPAVRVNPPAPPPDCNVECIIRDVWSGESQATIDKAVRTAARESGPGFKVDAQNYCCSGIFQIYFSVHRAMLRTFGVFKASDLYDPRVNATVALALFHQVGWQPWNGGA